MTSGGIEMAAIDHAIRRWAAERRLPRAHLERWLGLGEGDRAALLETAERLRLRTGQFVSAFEMLEEIAVRERSSIAAELARGEIRRTLAAAGSAPGRARQLLEALRARRFPRLKRATERLAAAVARLGLPPGIRVVLPRELSSDEVRVEISAHGAEEMARLIDALAHSRDGLERLADLAGGTGSIDDEV